MSTKVTILILIDGFLQLGLTYKKVKANPVTILILIDGFLQSFFTYNVSHDELKSQSLF